MIAALRITLVLAALTAAASAAHAQDATALRARSLAATCAQCHGTDGRSADSANTAVPALAGMPAATLVAQMTAFKNGTRSGTVMPQIAKGFNDAQIAQLAAWFAAAPAR
jgi:cytochrome c553